MEYMLKSSLALTVTYLLYYVFARKNSHFKWLRAYFLVAIMVSFSLPALKYLPDFHQQDLISVPSTYVPAWIQEPVSVMVESQDSMALEINTSKSKLQIAVVLRYLYFAGVLVLLFRFIIGLLHLTWLAAKNRIRRINHDSIVIVKNLSAPFSFFQLIFIGPNDLVDKRKTAMLQHERVHVRQWHSLDLLLLEFVSLVQWFNPFAWLIRRALKEVHEYLADAGTVKGEVSPLEYQQLLLSQALGVKSYLPANGFKSSLTKKRILMITNNKTNKKWLAVLVLLVISTLIIDSFTRIGILRASGAPILNRALEIFDPSPQKSNPLNSESNDDSLSSIRTEQPSESKIISHKIAVKDFNLKVVPFKYGDESGIHLVKDGADEYGFIGRIRELKEIVSGTIDSITSVTCVDGGGVMGSFSIENITVAYNSFISTPGQNVIYPHGYESSKEILVFLRNKLNNPRILNVLRRNAGAHFQVGVSLNKLGRIKQSFLSTSSDSREIDNGFVQIFRSIPSTCFIKQNDITISGEIIYLMAIYVSSSTNVKDKTGKNFEYNDSIN